jgi:hypothetical protein
VLISSGWGSTGNVVSGGGGGACNCGRAAAQCVKGLLKLMINDLIMISYSKKKRFDSIY